jgi:hypothetical protein
MRPTSILYIFSNSRKSKEMQTRKSASFGLTNLSIPGQMTFRKIQQAMLTEIPIYPALLEEGYRIALTIWFVPWAKDTVKGWMELIAILHGFGIL